VRRIILGRLIVVCLSFASTIDSYRDRCLMAMLSNDEETFTIILIQ
jgi:hypothetical protein